MIEKGYRFFWEKEKHLSDRKKNENSSCFYGKNFEKNKIGIGVICLFTDFYVFTSPSLANQLISALVNRFLNQTSLII
jgi:hypothetical protein